MNAKVLSEEADQLIEEYKQGYDLTLIKDHLRLTVDERFERLLQMQALAEEFRHAALEARSKK